MIRRSFAVSAATVLLAAGPSVLACDLEARERAAHAIQAMPGGSGLDSAQLEMALEDLCGARDRAVLRAEKDDQLEWRPVIATDREAAGAQATSAADTEEDEPETTTILGMEFRKADADSEGRRRLMKKR